MKLFSLLSLIIFPKSSLVKREFCFYSYKGVTLVVDPYYTNSNNLIMYYETTEEYICMTNLVWSFNMC